MNGTPVPFWLRTTLFGLLVTTIVALTSIYVFRRGARALNLGKKGRSALAALLVSAPIAMIGGRFVERTGASELAFALEAYGAIVVLGVLVSTVLLLIFDLPFVVLGRLHRKRAHAETDPATDIVHETHGELPGPSTLGRRELIRNVGTGVALSVGFGSAGYGAIFGRHDYVVPEVPIPLAGLSPRLDGYRIAQISDIHFGIFVGEPEMARAVSLVRSARPDLIVLTGDLLDHDPAFAPVLGRLVRRLNEVGARDGVVVIAGNHDYYAGIEVVLSTVREGGARVLRNSGRVIGDAQAGFALVGVDDVWARRNGHGPGPDLSRALAMVPRDLPRVLLCHNPEFFPRARGKVGLQLSGHTHGGQVNLGVRPADLFLPYVAGLYVEEGSRLYVNRGFGTAGPPARVGAPPEVTLLVLTAA